MRRLISFFNFIFHFFNYKIPLCTLKLKFRFPAYKNMPISEHFPPIPAYDYEPFPNFTFPYLFSLVCFSSPYFISSSSLALAAFTPAQTSALPPGRSYRLCPPHPAERNQSSDACGAGRRACSRHSAYGRLCGPCLPS